MKSKFHFLQWLSNFCQANVVFLIFINIYYLTQVSVLNQLKPLLSWPAMASIILFDSIVVVGHSMFLILPILALGWIMSHFNRYHTYCRYSLYLLTSLIVIFIFFDNYCYHIYHFHLNGLLMNLLLTQDIQEFVNLSTLEWLSIIAITFTTVLVEIIVGERLKTKRFPNVLLLVAFSCTFMSYLISAFTLFEDSLDPHMLLRNQAIRLHSRALPLYTLPFDWIPKTMRLDKFLHTNGHALFFQDSNSTQSPYYPKNKLLCRSPKKPLNILVIMADSWRADQLNPTVSPNTYRFSQENIRFLNHYSGGNCTKAGLFSFFYGIPVSYWNTMLKYGQGPVLLHQLKQAGYHTGIFTSARNDRPPYNKTLFVGEDELITYNTGKFPVDRDKQIIEHFKKFIGHDKRPFFSFLFFNSSHSYCQEGKIPDIFIPSIKQCNRIELGMPLSKNHEALYFNRYRNAVHFVDNLIGRVLDFLKQHHLLDNTIIIITSDHGEEFNDNKNDFWGHTSNFSDAQIKVPFIIHWPGKKSRKLSHFTTHYDLSSTLMHDYLNCSNNTQDYSIGKDLFSSSNRLPFPVGSYLHLGMRGNHDITEIFPDGQVRVYDLHYNLLMKKPDTKTLVKFFNINQAYSQNRQSDVHRKN